MRRKRDARVLFWPTLAAVAIIVILMGAGPLRPWLGLPDEPLSDGWAGWVNRHAPFRSRVLSDPPPTLDARGHAHGGLLSDGNLHGTRGVDPTGNRDRLGSRLGVEPRWLLPPPSSPPAQAVLMAPVRDDREELAGLATESQGATSLAAANSNTPPTRFSAWGQTVSLRSDQLRSGTSSEDASRSVAETAAAANRTAGVLADEAFADESHSGLQQDRIQAARSATGSAVSAAAEVRQPPTDTESSVPSDRRLGLAWPRTPALEERLTELADQPAFAAWCQQVRSDLRALQSIPSIQAPEAGTLLETLRAQADQAIAYGETFDHDRALQQLVLRTAHSLRRRAIVWQAVWELSAPNDQRLASTRVAGSLGRASIPRLDPLVDSVRRSAESTGDAAGWQRYLMLDDIERLGERVEAGPRRLLAQRVLSRIDWDGLSAAQSEWLQQPEIQRLTAALRPWAESPIDYVALLDQLERLESDALDLGSIDVARAVQNLRFSANPAAVAVARSINNDYRNANLRMAVSAELIERLLPEIPDRITPIEQRIAGVPVRGSGVVSSRLGFQLQPDPDAWQLLLSTRGSIRGRTGSEQWPVRLANWSHSDFGTYTPVRIDRHGVQMGSTDAQVQTHVQLRGMRTEFDGLPIIESLVRSFALAEYRDRSPLARRQSEYLVRSEIEDTVSAEIEREIDKSSATLSRRLLGPLGRLQLDPLVVDLTTTEDRLSVRYRLAGDWQMASFTPRPRALSDSLLSVQVHQSMLNNTFEQLAPAGEPQPLGEMRDELLRQFGIDRPPREDDFPEEVSIQFASTRPVTVEIEDGKLWLTLRVVQLRNDRDLNLSHFIVRATYLPVVDGLRTRLVRDGALHVDGPRMGMRERLPVRAIFNKVLNKDRHLPLVAADLANHPQAQDLTVGQLQLTDGWLCLAICPK